MDHLALLEGEVAAMAAALRASDLAADVPACPGWTVQDLCNHVTAIHRWALGALRDEGPPPYDEPVSSPEDYATASSQLVQRLREAGPDAPCWTFNREDRTAALWRRRQLHEVAVHRWDVERHDLDPAVAADGIDEVVRFFLPRQLALARTTVPDGSLVLASPEGTWELLSGPGPAATVHGSAADLNLLLWGRRTLDEVVVEGDTAHAAAVFAAALTP